MKKTADETDAVKALTEFIGVARQHLDGVEKALAAGDTLEAVRGVDRCWFNYRKCYLRIQSWLKAHT